MAKAKTIPTEQSVETFLDTVSGEKVRDDCRAIVRLMEKVTGEKPRMWGPSIVGFGSYRYRYESGHEGDICLTGFSPRKQNLSLYVLAGFPGQEAVLGKLGKYKAGKGCLHVKKLEDIDIGVLETLINKSIGFLKMKYPEK
jgi:hypothetical protein